jgi:hypothetical protein
MAISIKSGAIYLEPFRSGKGSGGATATIVRPEEVPRRSEEVPHTSSSFIEAGLDIL